MVGWQRRILLFFLIASLATILLMPLASNTLVPVNVDYLSHIAAIIQARVALFLGQFPLRVVTNSDGLSYPLFQFYSSSSYTFAGFIHQWLTPTNPFVAYKVTIWCALVAGGIYMHRLAYWLTASEPAAILASIAYLTAPYVIIVINHIGAFNEAVALGLLPMVLFYTLHCYSYPVSIRTLLLTGLAWYLLATTHLLTFLATSLFVFLLLLIRSSQRPQHWRNWIGVLMAYIFGCVLAMWYLAPIIIFAKYLIANRTFNSAATFYAYAPSLRDLLSPTATTAGELSSVGGFTDSIAYIHPNVGLPILLAVCVAAYAVFQRRKSSSGADHWVLALIVLFVAAFILVWTPLNFWKWLPQSFLALQYSWRLLGQVTWIGALLMAWAVCWFFKNQISTSAGWLMALLIIISTSTWFVSTNLRYASFSDMLFLMKSADFYAIDAEKHHQFINAMDNMLIDSGRLNDTLGFYSLKMQLKLKPINIPVSLLNTASMPFLSLRGNALGDVGNQQLLATVNNTIINQYQLRPGKFQWDIPLSSVRNSLQKQPVISLQLVAKSINKPVKTGATFAVPLDEIVLGGFLPATQVLDVKQLQPHCQQQSTIICRVSVPAAVHLLELPVFYYPGLLNITLNGKVVPYFSVFYLNHLVAAIIPHAGDNVVKIQFRGLLWANYLSAVAWQLWGLLFIYIVLRAVVYKSK